MNTDKIDAQIQTIAELFIEKLESLSVDDNWQKPWIDQKMFMPINARGTTYGGSNMLSLALYTDKMKFNAPVFLTFKQAADLGASVKTGEKSFPVIYNDRLILHNDQKIKPEDYEVMSDGQKKECKVLSYLKYYNVFNLDQTTIKEVNPELYGQLVDERKQNFEEKNFFNSYLTSMMENKTWACPIYVGNEENSPLIPFQYTNSAFYNINKDFIHLPEMKQFNSETDFFGTLLHEMAHSTGHNERLNRFEKNEKYPEERAREELVAEMTSALTGMKLGTQVKIDTQNTIYIKSWLAAANKDSKYIYDCIRDVVKASNFICDKIGYKNQLQLAKESIVKKISEGETSQKKVEKIERKVRPIRHKSKFQL